MLNLASKSKNQDKTYINQMFAKIANKYDFLNNLISLSLHKQWKKEAIMLAIKERGNIEKALDLCSGTGDLALILKELSPNTYIISLDSCKEMLEILKNKILKGQITNFETVLGDAENPNYKEASFDLISIGFGLRNLTNKELCIKNSYKLLKTHGVFVCIDLGHPKNLFWKKIYYAFFFKAVPTLGSIFAKNKEAYSYLPNSLLSWYTQEELTSLLYKSGFKKAYFKNILGGAVAIHIAVRGHN